MRVKIFSTNLGTVFDPKKDYVSDKRIILEHHPVEPTEGTTKGYADEKLEEFYRNPDIKGTVTNTEKLKLKGPQITHRQDGLFLNDTIGSEQTGVMFRVDEFGRILEVFQPDEENLDPSTKIKWSNVSKTPTTLQGYGITDLAYNDHNNEVTGKVSVKYQPRITKSPVPYSYLTNKFYTSGYELKPGAIVIKLKTPDTSRWKQANGAVIYRSDYPEAVTNLAGASASQATLPDAREHDRILLETYGVDAKTYVLVK